MYGYADPTIAKLIQELPGAEKCTKYIPQQFVPASAKNVGNVAELAHAYPKPKVGKAITEIKQNVIPVVPPKKSKKQKSEQTKQTNAMTPLIQEQPQQQQTKEIQWILQQNNSLNESQSQQQQQQQLPMQQFQSQISQLQSNQVQSSPIPQLPSLMATIGYVPQLNQTITSSTKQSISLPSQLPQQKLTSSSTHVNMSASKSNVEEDEGWEEEEVTS